MSIDEQPMNVYWSGKRTETSNNFKTNYKGSVATKNNLPNSDNKTGDMYNVTESDENFIWNGNFWDSLSGDTLKILNWQKSEKAGAVTIYPVPETTLEPTVDFLFTETGPASGDKGPENPSAISGVSSVTVARCGKNLIVPPYYNDVYRDADGVTVDPVNDGSIKITKPATTGNKYYNFVWSTLKFPPGTEFILSMTVSSGTLTGSVALQMLDADTGSVLKWQYIGNTNTVFTLTTAARLRFRLYMLSSSTASNVILSPQIELGSVVTEYEKGEYNSYSIDLNDTYYGGSIDLTTGVMTVTHVAMTPDASTVDISFAPAAIPLDYADTYGRTIISVDGTTLVVGSTGGTVVYKLATPQTVQLPPTQILSLAQTNKYTPRLNTIYTDAKSVHVGYAKSPIRSEYELTQAIIATEGGE